MRGTSMITTLFWIMCAVLGAHVVVAVIVIARAYRANISRPEPTAPPHYIVALTAPRGGHGRLDP